MNTDGRQTKFMIKQYLENLHKSFDDENIEKIEELTAILKKIWEERKKLFVCGNGGSAANALHIANDMHYGVGVMGKNKAINGINVEALPANCGVLTCLANDISYDEIYSQQIEVKAQSGDLVIVLSGSGNSKNVIKAIETAKAMDVITCAIVAYDGGRCKEIADLTLHFKINDMQIAEDTQLVVGHLCMQSLNKSKMEEVL